MSSRTQVSSKVNIIRRLSTNHKITKGAILTGLVVTAVAIYAIIIINLFVKRINGSWEAMKFAYDYPELVVPVKEQYEIESSALKDSIVKRQSLISPIPEEDIEIKK